tara:strand:+ start:1303 stop:1563 length:261 start_codon:yes stop_codon:yes gene_type:complete
MNINDLISIVKKKLENSFEIKKISIEDKSFLHKNHSGNQKDKFHLKLNIYSEELKRMGKIESNKKIYKVLNEEIKKKIHSIQIKIY